MTNKNILTYNAKISKLKQDYYSPVATIGINNLPLLSYYCFLSRVLPWENRNIWTNELEPDVPTQDQKYLKNVFKNMIIAKKINSSDISPVVQRIDWTSGTVYDIYRDDIDLFEEDDNGFLVNTFYVKNRYDQVFKCLWNNNNSVSTNEPFFQPGSYGTNNIFTGTDKYKWKYIFTIDRGSKIKFMDSNWIPVPINNKLSNPLISPVGVGNIDVINITNQGSGYDKSKSTISVNIVGDGTGASANVELLNGHINNIVVDNTGSNYTYANVTIVSSDSKIGSGATAFAPVSPIGGHGFNPLSELGCRHIMFTCEFNDRELVDGIEYLPVDIDYRQVGLMVDPVSLKSSPNPANTSIYKAYTELHVTPGFGQYINDEIIYQGSNLNNSYFKALVLHFDPVSNIVRILNMTGTPTLNAPISSSSSKTTRTLMSIDPPDLISGSGEIIYLENRDSVQRSYNSIEQFRFVLHY